ncbi:vq domain-containing protein [Abeliophyllum distichum]|uniref:Vq domain-containing protein n=1 Tax=Abeliophyllum distichum TaxID=126358 RepID=A0ABD1PB34_9LAMI
MDIRSVPRVMESKKKSKSKRGRDDSLKVVYISSPMKVKTSASRFRSLVQELTGRHSDVSRYMENNGDTTDFHEIVCDDDDRVVTKSTVDDEHASLISSMDNCRESSLTTTSSDSFLEPIDDVFSSQMNEHFGGFFSSNLLYDSSQFDDVLGSYDEL